MLISDSYRAMNAALHVQGGFGISGGKWAKTLLEFCTQDILDYGCGNRTLEKALGFPIRNYDPAIPELSAPPEPASLVACTDVLEHVEPECLDAVLDDLRRVTKDTAFLVIATRLASKTLPDGRNAHLIVQPLEWWLEKINQRFFVYDQRVNNGEVVLICGPR
jgi:hypothetical protein